MSRINLDQIIYKALARGETNRFEFPAAALKTNAGLEISF
jgi:hypothetical protein